MPAINPPQWGVWGTGSGNWQRSTIAWTTTNSSTATGVGGSDYTRFGILTTSDALVIGVDGTYSNTRAAGTDTNSPGGGAYLAYINGGFSGDFSFLALSLSTTGGAAPTPSSDSYSYTGDLQYRYNLPNAWWFEPTVGATYSNTFFNAVGAATGEVLTVQGGARLGTETPLWNGVRVQTTFFGLAYSNVVENTGGLPGAPNIGIVNGIPLVGVGTSTSPDRGQVWGKGDAKFNFVFNQHFSSYVEGAIYGTDGNLRVLGGGVFGGLRYVFN